MRKYYELFLLSLARNILEKRNVKRSSFISRRDNNDLSYMAEKITQVESRMKNNYE